MVITVPAISTIIYKINKKSKKNHEIKTENKIIEKLEGMKEDKFNAQINDSQLKLLQKQKPQQEQVSKQKSNRSSFSSNQSCDRGREGMIIN